MKKVNSFLKIALSAIILSACASGNGLFYNGKIIQKKCGNESTSKVYDQDVKMNRSDTKVIIQDVANESSATGSEMNSVNQGDVASLSNELVLTENKSWVQSVQNHSVVSSAESKKVKFSKSSKSNKAIIYVKKDSYKDFKKSSRDDVDKVVIIILCFFIPPLAVYLFEGSWTSRCTLNLILTLLCGLPGIIHALVVVLK